MNTLIQLSIPSILARAPPASDEDSLLNRALMKSRVSPILAINGPENVIPNNTTTTKPNLVDFNKSLPIKYSTISKPNMPPRETPTRIRGIAPIIEIEANTFIILLLCNLNDS